MQLFLFVLCACALALVSANGHDLSPQANNDDPSPRAKKGPTFTKQKKGPTVVKCMLKLKKCSRSASQSEQRNCLIKFKTCTEPYATAMSLASIGGERGLLARYAQCMWGEQAATKDCITKYLSDVMKAEKRVKFRECSIKAIVCYSSWEGIDMSKKPEACNVTLSECLEHIEKAPKGHEKAFPCYKQSNDQKVGHHKFVECLGDNKLLAIAPKKIYCGRKAYAGAKTCNEACKLSYQKCLWDGRRPPIVNRYLVTHHVVNHRNRPVNPYRNQYVNRQGYNNRQGTQAGYNHGNQGTGYAQGTQGNQDSYAQGNQGGDARGNQGGYRGNSQQGINQPQNGGAAQQGY